MISRSAFVLWISCVVCHAQLHLLTGSPSPNSNVGYPSSLIPVGSDGTLLAAVAIAPGSEWISLSYDWNLAVIFPRGDDHLIRVLDFQKAAVVKTCEDPPSPIGGLMDQWFIDSPSAGPVFAEYLLGGDVSKAWLRGMSLAPNIPCAKSFANLDTTEIRFVATNGWAGVGDLSISDSMLVGIAQDGTVSKYLSGSTTYLGPKVPAALLNGLKQPFGAMLSNDRHAMVLGLNDKTDLSRQRLLIYRKKDQNWSQISLPGDDLEWVRGFGNFVAVIHSYRKGANHMTSAGESEWRRASVTGPVFNEGFHFERVVFPGRLYLYDVETKKTHSIETNQGDSEIVLVADNMVYYRVSDRLYQAKITESGIGPAKLLAADEAIRDAHWAFIKR